MAKRPKFNTPYPQRKTGKRNVADLTLRNLAAAVKRLAKLSARVDALERTVKLWTDGVHLDPDMPGGVEPPHVPDEPGIPSPPEAPAPPGPTVDET